MSYEIIWIYVLVYFIDVYKNMETDELRYNYGNKSLMKS